MTAQTSRFSDVFRSPRRISITVPHSAFCELQNRSDMEGRSLSNLAAYLLETALERAAHTPM